MSTPRPKKIGGKPPNRPKNRILGEKISEGYKRLGMYQYEFAEQIGVTTEAVRKWEEGSEPNLSNYRRICEVLGIDPETKDFVSSGAILGGKRSTNDSPSGQSEKPNSAPVYIMPISPSEGQLLQAANQIGHISTQVGGVLFVYLHHCAEMRPTLPQGICVPIRPVSGGIESIIAAGIYVYRFGSQYQVRRLVYSGKGIVRALADNPQYPPLDLPVEDSDEFELLGFVDLNL